MKSKKELLDLAQKLSGVRSSRESFFRFLADFAGRINREKSNVDTLFECLKYCRDNPGKAAVKMGVTGKDTGAIFQWCDYILKNNELRSLGADELTYLFACGARFCKANAGESNNANGGSKG